METSTARSRLDPNTFRTVLGQYPTGVTAITCTTADETQLAMVVGSFSSVSLDPPLVSFMAAKTSSSFADLREQSTFCANVLAGDQEDLCRQLAAKNTRDKLAGLQWRPSPLGNPIIIGTLAWIECRVVRQVDAGDHVIVLGEVLDLEATRSAMPLLFLGGGYGRFSAHSRVMGPAPDVMRQLHVADLARRSLESLCLELDVECALIAPVEDVLVRVASALPPRADISPARVGVRLPFQAPMGAVLIAWSDPKIQRRWVQRARVDLSEEATSAHLRALANVRKRGWTVTLIDDTFRQYDARLEHLAAGDEAPMPTPAGQDVYDPPLADRHNLVRNISAPVWDADGTAAMYLSLFGFAQPMRATEIAEIAEIAVAAAADITTSVAADSEADR